MPTDNNSLSSLTILYADDDKETSLLVSGFLRGKCNQLLLANTGREALKFYEECSPDMVISRVSMSDIDGLELSEIIKKHNSSIPIILIASCNSFERLHRAIDIGIDHYVLKPIDLNKLNSALLKSANLLLKTRELEFNRIQLAAYKDAAEDERILVAELMKRMMQPNRMTDQHVQFWLDSADHVSGDLIAFRRSRNGRLYVMLADSTGHGLPAALNLLPINHIFYSKVEKGLPISTIVEKMNMAIKAQSPADRFVCAFVACIDIRNRFIEVWNGGMPTAFLVNEIGEIYHSFKSVNLPLGVIDESYIAHTEIYQWSCPSQLIVYSDGLVEAENENGDAWGTSSINRIITNTHATQRLDAIKSALQNHLGKQQAIDDTALLTVDCPVCT